MFHPEKNICKFENKVWLSSPTMHGDVLAEDAAESFGATYKGKQTGTFGSGNIISFNGNNLLFPKGEKVVKIA